MSILDVLLNFKNEAVDLLKDLAVLAAVEEGENGSDGAEICWTRGTYFSIIPFEAELAGAIPSKKLSKEPSNKKNCSKNYTHNGQLVRVETYNAQGVHNETEFVKRGGTKLLSWRINNHDEKLWIKIAEIEEGRVTRSCRVDSDGDYWLYSYIWQGDRISKILSCASNSAPGIVLAVKYNLSGTVTSIDRCESNNSFAYWK